AVYDKDGVVITAIAVNHGHIWPAVGYRIDYKGRSAVISGDTSKSQNLAKHAKGADLLLHEALNQDMVNVMGEEFEKDGRPRLQKIFHEIQAIHATPVDAAETAEEAGVKTLVLTHLIPPLPSPILYGSFMKGASEKFSGGIVIAEDGMLFSLPAGSEKISRRKIR
ncbi:MAG: MBL fold metallo-hydrolase, partial [Parvularculaceae bacterium]